MKKLILLIFFFLFMSHHSFSQLNEVPDIELTDIEKGINDFDVLRIKLLENGFYLDEKIENKGDYVLMEGWKREESINDNTSYIIQISKILYDKSRYLNAVSISGSGENLKDFSNILGPQIKNNFETKHIENVEYELSGEKSEKYELVYSTQRNNIKVTVENRDERFSFFFKIIYSQ